MSLAAKLQIRAGQSLATVLMPSTLEALFVGTLLASVDAVDAALLVFVIDRSALTNYHATIVKAASADRLTWVAYPKAGQLGTDLNRDSLASLLRESGVQPVRQIALDDVWSALRFRPL